MVRHQTFTQAVHEGIEVHSAAERAECRRVGMRTLAGLSDSVALRAHSFRECAALLFQRTRRALLGGSGCRAQQEKNDGEARDQLSMSPNHSSARPDRKSVV